MVNKYLENLDDLTKLSQKIVRSHPKGFIGAVVDGPRGYGKSAFCMHVMREVYQYIDGIDRVDAWKKVLNYTLFTMNDVIDALEVVEDIDFDNILESQVEHMIPCICCDDAGRHMGRLKHFIDMTATDRLNSVMDTARDAVTGFLFNAPEREGLLSFIRRYRDNFWITIGLNPDTMGDKYKRVATVRRFVVGHDGKKRTRLAFQTKFSCYIDKWVYEEYQKKKIGAIRESLKRLKELQERRKVKK